jgi:hypothetical protein
MPGIDGLPTYAEANNQQDNQSDSSSDINIYGDRPPASLRNQAIIAALAKTLVSLVAVGGVWAVLELFGGSGIKHGLLSWIYPGCDFDTQEPPAPGCDVNPAYNGAAVFGEQLVWALVAFTVGNLVHYMSNRLEFRSRNTVSPQYDAINNSGNNDSSDQADQGSRQQQKKRFCSC